MMFAELGSSKREVRRHVHQIHRNKPVFAGECWWRRGESNPRPRSLATRRLHAYPVPRVSPEELRTGKTLDRLVR
jgi:hypothetical protein